MSNLQDEINCFIEQNIDLIDNNDWYSIMRKCPHHLKTYLLQFLIKADLDPVDEKEPYFIIRGAHQTCVTANSATEDVIEAGISSSMDAHNMNSYILFRNPLDAEKFRLRFVENNEFLLADPVIMHSLSVDMAHKETIKYIASTFVKVLTEYGNAYISYHVAQFWSVHTPRHFHLFDDDKLKVPVSNMPGWWLG